MKYADIVCCVLAVVFLGCACYYNGAGDANNTAFYMGLAIIQYLAVVHQQLLENKHGA